ncbi:SDR family NAD(P)-dependent oxidoreductase [Alloyangia pacifica]|uniref:NAD(P)-dependent dehydrogenase, short-chain alcohol dehydrogenase family n=1 Tax=Alloyangia pacifica TaxID=311180 RepID=A0A1I6QNY4_9RHOB|nr:SDR family oxidoreductase [Alloyangia pacifica]SDF94052.1 NAD(P)-dependent dehydrogenase, short-chain alcohol dehydrogenase family [Alloyangia pacifica]SFS54104.1 NAD(P)-dependent dehydrogenase, short-chain alcohol dehydrogenase family [Alloyangia pacifica]
MRRAIVTGGSGLIGRGICARLIAAGWEVASFDLAEDGPACHIRCDVSDEASVKTAFDKLGWDRLDLLVSNAGRTGGIDMELGATSLDDWNGMIGSHLTGAFLMSRATLPLMGQGGAIVIMASTRALMSEGGDFAYAAAKGGLIGLTQALAVQLGPRVRVNAIAPGWISGEAELAIEDHAQHPAGRVGRSDDIADAVLYLADAGFVTGQTLTIDGGMTKKMIYAE